MTLLSSPEPLSSPPRTLLFGVGSIGAIYSWIIGRVTGESNVYAVCRSNYTAASKDGFTIHSTSFGNDLHVKPVVVRSADEARQQLANNSAFDYVFITAKAIPSTPSIPDLIRPAIGSNTAIVLVQNGIGIEEIYHTAFPNNPILSCIAYVPATQTSPGVVEHSENEHLHIGTYPSDAPDSHKTVASKLAALLHAGGASATVHADIQGERWSKLLVNAAWNPICALSRSRDAQFLHSSSVALDTVRQIMLEVASIARASGYSAISPELAEWQISRAQARELPGVEPSMQADALAGRRMEVDAIVGNVLKIAEVKGVQTPLLRLVYALLKALDERRGEGGS